ncbi:MAG: hypothetical protein ACK40O_06480 [Allosphingosinicella sp.]
MQELLVTMNQLLKVAKDIGSRVRDRDSISPPRSPVLGAAAERAARRPEPLVETALALISQHRQQPFFEAPELFDNRNWLLVLELFIASCSDAEISVKEASLALGGATSTALRRLLTLEKLGIIVSREDPNDGRRRLVSLSASATESVCAYLRTCAQDGPGFARFRLRLRVAQDEAAGGAKAAENSVVEHHFAPVQARTVSEPKSVSLS